MSIIKKGIYKHFKGDYYIVEDIGINSEDNKEYVIYRALYDDNKLYIRELSIFLSDVDKVKYPNVSQKKRFEYVKIESVKK